MHVCNKKLKTIARGSTIYFFLNIQNQYVVHAGTDLVINLTIIHMLTAGISNKTVSRKQREYHSSLLFRFVKVE